MSKTRKTWLAAGVTVLLASGAPGFVAPGLMQTVQAQSQKITGTVVDEFGDPIIGANIRVKGTTNGAVTDIDGKFSLDAKAGSPLEISYIGYASQTLNAANGMTVTLREDSQSLEDVVVVGYGVQKKKLVTGATVQVKGEDISKLNTSNALSAMQASTPGVNITQSSSQPGKGFKVNIRGVGTINGASPLLIIDGVNAGTADDGLNGLNPNEIESIDVLKDAASAAIYGSRAANGVILVTTKQGKAGKVTAQYDGFVGWSNPYKRPATLNAQQYMQIVNEANFAAGNVKDWVGDNLIPQSIYDKVKNGWEGTDWFDLYTNKNALQHSHSLNITGGTDRSKFSMSLSYSNQDGIMGGDMASNYERYSGRINSDHVILKSADGKRDIIKVGENLSYWHHKSHDLAEEHGYWNIMQACYTASPLVPAYREDGTLTSFEVEGQQFNNSIFSNPLAGLLNGSYNAINKNRNFGVGATFYLEIEPIKNLKWRGQMNTGFSASNYRNFTQPYSQSQTVSSKNYELGTGASESSSINLEHTLSYILPEISGHHIDVLVGQSLEKSLWNYNIGMSYKVGEDSANSLLANGFGYAWGQNFGLSNISGASNNGDWQSGLASVFGRINWNYKERYMATLIARGDGSSNFAKGHRWGFFPSVSAGWVITNEKFMESTQDWMDFLKFRASWGQNGNCNIDNFYYLANIGFSPTDYADYAYKFDSNLENTLTGTYQTGAYAKNLANEDLTWETSEQLNIGLDARFINSKLGVAFDWYKKTTKDWLVKAPSQKIYGVPEDPWVNGGDVENTGFELALNWNDNITKDLHYFVNVNMATNKNEVTKLATDGARIDGQANALFQGSSYAYRVEVGHPIGYFYGMDYDGIWQNQAEIDAARAAGRAVLDDAVPGDMKWIDHNNDGQITEDGDRFEIGDPNPDFTLGVSLGFDWKGLDFSVTGSGQFGQQVMQYFRTAYDDVYVNYTTDIFDRWHGEGTSNTQPRLSGAGHTNDKWISTRYVQDADFFRIQNVTLGYDVKKIWKACPFGQLRIYAQAQNLYTFTGYTGVDPEVGSNGGKDSWARGIDVGLYPTARTYIVGATIKF